VKTVLSVLLIAFGASAQAQDGKTEWDKLIADARKEGRVAVGGPIDPSARVFLSRQWQKDFPGIELNYSVAGGFDWGNRVKAERANGKYLWDVFLNGPNIVMYQHAASGTFAELQSVLVLPELKDPKTWRRPWDDLAMDKSGRMMSMFAYPSAIFYNAKKIDPAKVQSQGLDILLDPALKGRIAWNDPRTAGAGSNYAVMLHELMGRDRLKKLIVEQESVFHSRPTQATEAIMRGKADVVIGIQMSDVPQYKDAGVDVDLRPIGADAKTAFLGFGGAVLAVFTPAAHPNAAKLFANWVLTREVQDGFGKASQWDSVRADVAPVSPDGQRMIPGETYIESQKERMLERREQAMAYIRELRPQ
jgi:ABC-type Fe3+ transport system substrate-binding protein